MSFTIYYPATVFLITLFLSYIFVFSVLAINNIRKDGIHINGCKNLFGYFIVHIIITGFYILSLLTNRCCKTGFNLFLMTVIYYLSFITIYTTLTSNIYCFGAYYNITVDDYDGMFYTQNDNNVIMFFHILEWNIVSAIITFNLMILSFIYSQVFQLFSSPMCNENNKDNTDEMLIVPYKTDKDDKINDGTVVKAYYTNY